MNSDLFVHSFCFPPVACLVYDFAVVSVESLGDITYCSMMHYIIIIGNTDIH